MHLVIGVLALQGAFAKHVEMLRNLNVLTIEVRTQKDLNRIDGLILPGGESTVMTKLIQEADLLESFQTFAKHHPLFGTCAGLILLSAQGICPLFDVTVERNAYGRQIDSFSTSIELLAPLNGSFLATFIRAPIIRKSDPQVKVLAFHQNNAILIEQNHHLAASFHPELTNDPLIHQYFLNKVMHVKQSKKRSMFCYRKSYT